MNFKDQSSQSPLHMICSNYNLESNLFEIVSLLVESKANPNLIDNKGTTPLDYLLNRESFDNRIVPYLFQTFSKEETQKILNSNFKMIGNELSINFVSVSLDCPISRSRIQVPVRSVFCSHIDVVDAMSVIRKPSIKCFICDKSFNRNYLRKDLFIMEILQNVKEDDVKIFVDLSYVGFDKNSDVDNKKRKQDDNYDQSNSSNKKLFINLIDD